MKANMKKRWRMSMSQHEEARQSKASAQKDAASMRCTVDGFSNLE